MATTKVDINLISATGTASSSTFLRGDGAWQGASFEALIGSTVISNDATISFTVDTTYDVYKFVIVDCVPATDNVDLWMRFGDSGGVDSGASDYGWVLTDHRADSATAGSSAIVLGANDNADAQMKICLSNAAGTGSATGEGCNAIVHVFANETSGGTMNTSYTTEGVLLDSGTKLAGMQGAGCRFTPLVLTTVQFLFESGNLTSGRITCFGKKHA